MSPSVPHALISCPDHQGDKTRSIVTLISPHVCKLRRSLPREGGYRKAKRNGQEIILYVPSRPAACAECAAWRRARGLKVPKIQPRKIDRDIHPPELAEVRQTGGGDTRAHGWKGP